jgi:hypothetical protein
MNIRSALAAATAPLAWRAVLVLMAALAVAAEWIMPRELAEYAAAPAAPGNAAPAGGPTAARVAGTYPAIAAQPLFYATRQPWAPPPAAETKAPSPQAMPVPLANYTLTGVVMTSANRVALLKSSTTAKTVTLAEGRDLDGWTLREISREHLRFESGGTIYDMRFPTAKTGSR